MISCLEGTAETVQMVLRLFVLGQRLLQIADGFSVDSLPFGLLVGVETVVGERSHEGGQLGPALALRLQVILFEAQVGVDC